MTPSTVPAGDRRKCGIEVEVEAVAGKDRQTAWSQDERDGVEQGILSFTVGETI